MFRRVDLPAKVPGRLLLHSMPGRYEVIEKVWHQVKEESVGVIVCLAELEEIRLKSSAYADALENGTVPCAVLAFAIPEGGAPQDQVAFWSLVNDVASRLQSGEVILVHCVGGVGRTAMLAISVLIALGLPMGEAQSVISRAGSTLETLPQGQIISWCAAQASITL